MATRDEDFVDQVFVCNTHTPVLFFSSRGMVYKMKVYKLPLGTPQARGKALVNLLPLAEGESITTTMPLPEDEDTWSEMYVLFATSAGTVRRNRLSDFVSVKANGKIAMKLEEGATLVSVQTCSEENDVLLASAKGKCMRFPGRPTSGSSPGRNSVGVRGMQLAKERRGHLHEHPASGAARHRRARRLPALRQRAAPGGENAEDEPETCSPEEVGADLERRTGSQPWKRVRNSFCRWPATASASAPRPTSTGSRRAAARASTIWTCRAARVRRPPAWSPLSRLPWDRPIGLGDRSR